MSRLTTSPARLGMAFVALLCCPSMRANTLIVGQAGTPCPSAAYNTITAAINAALPGDTIQICPALYNEQLLITKPLTLEGISQQGVGRVLVQPAAFTDTVLPAPVGDLGLMAAISVVNASGVSIVNLAIDASKNTVAGCTPGLAGIHFYNASGSVEGDAIFGTGLSSQVSCTTLFPGNGAGVQSDQSDTNSHQIIVLNTSIHDFGRNGVLVNGAGETAYISSNSIQGIGPSTGVNQFGIFLANGATGEVTANTITQGNCGSIASTACVNQRSEGVVLRATGNDVLIQGNVISNVQYGIFVNGATTPIVTGNIIDNVDFNGVQIQASVTGAYSANRISHILPGGPCGLADIAASGSSQNQFNYNWVNDADCGIGYLAGDTVGTGNLFFNTLYQTLELDDYTTTPLPPPTEPGQ
jgi:parallel beta-helix repeat protein